MASESASRVLNSVGIEEKILEFSSTMPAQEWFDEIGDLTALRLDGTGGYYRANYLRGPLLYSLVGRYRPSLILELGTGRGYGTACMARALVDHDIDGRIVTVDRIAPETRQVWAIDRGSGPTTAELSTKEVWSDHFDPAWLERITRLTGSTPKVLSKWPESGLPGPDLGFIDAGHRYEEARHDFYAFMSIANPGFAVLLDDYVDRRHFGVKRLVDSELTAAFQPELIRTEWKSAQRDSGGGGAMGMVLIDSALSSGRLSAETVITRLAASRRQLRFLAAKDRVGAVPRFLMRAISIR